MNIYVLHSSDNVVQSNCIVLPSIITAIITIFNGLSDSLIILGNCFISIALCCCKMALDHITDSFPCTKTSSSIKQLELIIYDTSEVIQYQIPNI